MAEHFPHPDPRDVDRWYEAPGADFDPWHDPVEAQARELRQIRRYRLGFALLGFGLVIASLFTIGLILSLFLNLRQLRVLLLGWDFPQQTAVVWLTLAGAVLLWGTWPDESWRRRSGLMLMMFLGDVVLWSVDNADRLGLSDAPLGHEHFRSSLGQAMGWAEFALIASLAAGMATHLGEARALDLGRAVRSLTIVGTAVWAAYFFLRTNWDQPVWPLRERPVNFELYVLWLGSTFLSATVLVQVTMLSLFAGRASAQAARARRAAQAHDEPFLSRSEAGWDDFRNDRDRFDR